MEQGFPKGQPITAVEHGSPAQRAGIRVGDTLMAINGEAALDVIDYSFLTAEARLTLMLRGPDGNLRSLLLHKQEYEPLGLGFATSLMSPVRACKNRCVFCFVDQMPKGVRTSLSFKDDDWRLSFIMGNYVTLTNVPEAEFERILKRRVSPLYVSVHATDGAVRARMMQNPGASGIMERLRALKTAGLRFHAQIVLCPGWNDGDILDQSLRELSGLHPAAQSVAIVPVGLTRFRTGLTQLRGYTPDEARAMIEKLRALQARLLADCGTRFAFLADEWYALAGMDLPPYDDYEDFCQIENGVGLIRLFERDAMDELAGREKLSATRRFAFAGGSAATPYFADLIQGLAEKNVLLRPIAIQNDFFGERVTVAGLVTGGDLVKQLAGKLTEDVLLIPGNMLREGGDVFLDDMPRSEAERRLNVRILPVGNGTELIKTVFRE